MRAFTSRRTTTRPTSVRFCSITGNWKSSPLAIRLVGSLFITVPFSTGSKRRRRNLLDFHQSWNTTMSGRFKNWIPRIRYPCSNGLNGLFSVRLDWLIQSTFLLQSRWQFGLVGILRTRFPLSLRRHRASQGYTSSRKCNRILVLLFFSLITAHKRRWRA